MEFVSTVELSFYSTAPGIWQDIHKMYTLTSSRKSSLVLLCFLSALLHSSDFVLADQCSISPLSLPIANITLADGVTANRGTQIQIGGELLGLRLSTLIENVRVRNARDCQLGNATVASGCQGSSGSTYDLTKTPTWVGAPSGTFNVSVIDPFDPGTTVVNGWDMVKFFSTPILSGFPIEVWSSQTSTNKSGLALGPQSSVLDRLDNATLIPSKMFGLFYGSRSQLHGVDGNLTIGGYDAARVAGPWTNFSTASQFLGTTPCPLQVLVSDFRLNNAEGSFSLLDDTSSAVPFCLDPLQNDFTLSKSMYANFLNLTRTSDPATLNQTQITYSLSSEPLLGNLTITLANGFEVTIPHYEFVSQERGTTAEGGYDVVNASALSVPISVLSEDGHASITGTPVLGGVYLSMVYLLVDYANQQFSLAPAVQGALGDQDHKIVTICNSSTAATTSNSSSSGGGTNTTAAIVGAVLAAALILATLAVIWLVKRHRAESGKDSECVMQLADETKQDPAAYKEPDPVVQPQIAEKQGFRDVEEMEAVHSRVTTERQGRGESDFQVVSPLIGEMDGERRQSELEGDGRRTH